MDTNNAPIQVIEEAFKDLAAQNSELRESLDQVRMMFRVEDHGWKRIFGQFSDDMPGASIEDVKAFSKDIREYLVGNPLIKRGGALRSSYVWSKGVVIPGVERDPSKRGRVTELQRFFNDPRSKRFLFSAEAFEEMERCAFSDGNFILIGDEASKSIVFPLQLSEVEAVYVNPDYSGEVWGYLRAWDERKPDGKVVSKRTWFLTDSFPKDRKKPASIKFGSEPVPVDAGRVALDQRFNTQTGWTLGLPDAVAAVAWARIYSELMHHGKVMTESLAKFAMKVTAPTRKGASNVGVQVSSGGAGQTAVLGSGNDLVPLSSAGKSYDFKGLTQVAAQVATSIEVSTIHLLSDASSAGSSYGSAQNLDAPTKRATIARQVLWKSYIERVLRWATGEVVEVSFPPLDDDVYRPIQSVILAWNSGLLHVEEARDLLTAAIGTKVMQDVAPDGVMLPNNEFSLARRDVDTDGQVDKTAASGDQGVRNKSGGAGSDKNDIRDDTIRSGEVRLTPEEIQFLAEAVKDFL